MANTKKNKDLEAALDAIRKQFGVESIALLDSGPQVEVEWLDSGSLKLNRVLGGGYPRGRIVEIYGPESGGKTTLCLTAIAEEQKRGGVAAFIDAEHALDPDYARKLGVDTSKLLLSQPDTGEQALEIVEALVRSGAVSIIVIDSVAALTPKAELAGEMGQSHVGLLARLMSQAMRKLAGANHKTGTLLLFTNQIREKIGVMFGSPETTPGGRALKFYASQRVEVRRGLPKDTTIRDQRGIARIKIVKNKVAPPFKTCELDIQFNKGIVIEAEIVDIGAELGIVEKRGAFYYYKDELIGQGKAKAVYNLENDPVLVAELRELITKKIQEDKAGGNK